MSAARWLGVLLALALAACAGPMRPPPAPLTLSVDTVEPEAASGWTPRRALAGQRHMVAAANPLASEAGLLMLRAGGSAVDAAVAVQAELVAMPVAVLVV